MDSKDIPSEVTNGTGGSADTVDVFTFRAGAGSEKFVAPLSVHKDAHYYKMNHAKRGIAVIFNHEKFIFPRLKDRAGTQSDCQNLRRCWETLGFTVTVHNDLDAKELMDEIDALSKVDYTTMDCLVICVLSHGEEGVIYARNTAYKHESLWEKFTADKCKTLAGKPKMFFIQACQGSRLDPGVLLQTELDAGGDSYKIPIHADFLFAYSTIPDIYFSENYKTNKKFKKDHSCLNCFKSKPKTPPSECSCELEMGFFSWRNTTRGSWFVQALCAELQEHAYHYDILTLLTFVNRRVATEYESNTPGDYVMHAQKQIPCITSMLTRLVQFTPKKS